MEIFNEFNLEDDDFIGVCTAINVARLFLKDNTITPKKIIGLGNALYALERLPITTPGVYVEFSIEYRNGTEQYSEMKYVNFSITENEFQVSVGGSVYDSEIGSDSYTELDYLIGFEGYRLTEGDITDLIYVEDNVKEFLKLGAEINVQDDSSIQYE